MSNTIQIQEHRLCECNCGLPVKEGNRFIQWHHNHNQSEERRAKVSAALTGIKRSEEHKAKMKTKRNNWKGGRKMTHGYVLVQSKEHPHANSQGYVREHRLVYEQYHKCSLLPWADVHHIDRNRQNNCISNLKLFSHSEHARYEHQK